MLEDPGGTETGSISYEPSDTMSTRRQLDSKASKLAHHYRHLRGLGIPAPRPYGA
jgi:hypothetical protein